VFAAGLIMIVVVVGSILWLAVLSLAPAEARLRALAPPRFAEDVRPPSGPALHANPARELARMKQQELSRLNGFGWVDRKAGVAHIPIGRAIDILAKSGLPKVEAPPAGTPAPAYEVELSKNKKIDTEKQR
jgi:hypothetical protein